MLSSTKIEHRTINALKAIIDNHPTMEHQINENDKEMSWDGYIWLFKKNDGDQSKDNFDSRIPIQIKGHNDSERKYLEKQRISMPVELSDLKAYATEKGVLYFHIFIDGSDKEIFYSSLYPSKIADILESATIKGNSSFYSIPFVRFEGGADELYIVAKQFSNEAKKQGTAFTPLVQDRIRSDDFDKLTSVNLSVIGAKDSYSALLRLSSGDVCLYGKTAGDKYLRPIQWVDKSTFFIEKEVEQTLSIDDQLYYSHYTCIADSDGGMVLRLSPNLLLRLTEGKFSFTPCSTIRKIAHDANFLLKLNEASSFTVQGKEFRFVDSHIPDDFEKKLRYYLDLCSTLKMISFDIDTEITEYTELQLSQFLKLVNLRLGSYNNQIKDGISKYNWKFGDKYYPLFVIRNNDNIELLSSIYTKEYYVFFPDEKNPKERNQIPLFINHEIEVLGNLYRYDYDAFYEQIDTCDINASTADVLVECVLRMIDVFDTNNDIEFLNLADYLNKRLEPFVSNELILLNHLQIKRRQGKLSAYDKEALEKIQTKDVQILFGKSVLLGDKEASQKYYELLSETERSTYEHYPIYKLYTEL